METAFDFSDYKAFLRAVEDARKSFERGFRSKIAEQIGCQSGYISHVLNGSANFSLEQGLKAAEFLNLQSSERKYFLLLIQVERAGTPELKEHFTTELRALKEERMNIKGRVGNAKALTDSEQAVYYSSWHYLAVHVLTSLPGFNTPSRMAEALKIPEDVVRNVLLFLLQTGLIIEEKKELRPGITQVHLSRESPLINRHHINWRIAAIQSLVSAEKSDIHYSTVSSLSKKDAEKLRAEMVDLIERYVATIKPSPEEVMYGFNLDFFSLIKRT